MVEKKQIGVMLLKLEEMRIKLVGAFVVIE
jgi:hypothetical protein